jgi:hypothetical protein
MNWSPGDGTGGSLIIGLLLARNEGTCRRPINLWDTGIRLKLSPYQP